MFTFKKNEHQKNKPWANGFITEQEYIANQDKLKDVYNFAFSEASKRQVEIEKCYLALQNRSLETCKWVGAFYIATANLLKGDMLFFWMLPFSVGVLIVLFNVLRLYFGSEYFLAGKSPDKLVTPDRLDDSKPSVIYYVLNSIQEEIDANTELVLKLNAKYAVRMRWLLALSLYGLIILFLKKHWGFLL